MFLKCVLTKSIILLYFGLVHVKCEIDPSEPGMTETLSSDITSLLQEALNGSLENYEVKIDGGNEAGVGFLGEMVFVTLRNRSNNEVSHFVIKQTLSGPTQDMKELFGNLYFNEIYFYQKIVKEYEKFQKRFPKSKPFDKFPECLACQTEEGKQKILMKNLKPLGFKPFPRTGNFDASHTTILMRTYGQFHGISAAYREHNPEQFKNFASHLKDTTTAMLTNVLSESINIAVNHVVQFVEDEKIKEKLKIFTEKGVKLACNALKYNGKNPVVNHGDCWSNNVMFRYDSNGKVEDVVSVDFQLCRVSSVVNDLCHLLFCGVKKDILDNLDYYLRIYHDTFSDTLRGYDLNPDKIFTFEEVKQELKEHYAFGFIMSQVAWPFKLTPSYDKRNVAEIAEEEGNAKKYDSKKYYQDAFNLNEVRENCLNVMKYLFEADLL